MTTPQAGARIRIVCSSDYYTAGDLGTLTGQDEAGDWWAQMDVARVDDGHWCVYGTTLHGVFEVVP